MKKIMAMILILLLTFNTYSQKNRAEAILPAILAVEAYPYVMSALVSAGLVIYATADTTRVVQSAWKMFSDSTKQKIVDSVGTGGVVIESEYGDIRNVVKQMSTGTFTDTVPSGDTLTKLAWNSVINLGATYTIEMTFNYFGGDNVNVTPYSSSLSSNTYQWYIYYDKTAHTATVKVNPTGTSSSGCVTAGVLTVPSGGTKKIRLKVVNTPGVGNTIDITGDLAYSSTIGYAICSQINNMYGDSLATLYSVTGGGNIAYSLPVGSFTDSIADNLSWDLNGKKVGVPYNTAPEYAGKTVADIPVTNTQNPAGVSDTTGVTSGWLSNVYSKLSTISNTISKFFDFSQPLNFDGLKVAGATFTTKFPFSLPWDLKNALTKFSTTQSFNPNIHVGVQDTTYVHGMQFNIDLSMFNPLIVIIRLIELILFGIALILLTRKLLGGSV